jgi:hypothetical protein
LRACAFEEMAGTYRVTFTATKVGKALEIVGLRLGGSGE